ncbi:MAG: hypothetical protein OQL08_00170 [Gammaproteobacteria bacterium]|nr:hypothetical protein [Gammaproteobacteria bacterium]
MKQLAVIGGLAALLLTSAPLLATDLTLTLSSTQRRDIDFDTRTHTLGVKAVTPFGLVMCDYGRESGDTRIDTFDEIFGLQSVLTNNTNGYDATRLQCGYGLKLPLAGGELSGALGAMRYRGKTDTPVDGKEIELDALRLDAHYLRGEYVTRLQLLQTRYDYLYHHLSGSYDSQTAGLVRTLELQGAWGAVHGEAHYVTGEKEKNFTSPPLPLPDVNFDYDQLTLSLGPTITAGPLRYLAPSYIQGSERGSFNRLNLDSGIHGIVAGLAFGEVTLRLGYLETESSGARDYTPVTDDLAEARQGSQLSAELEGTAWSLKLENNRFTHDGYITVTSTPLPYTVLTGCATTSCTYTNVRREDEWKLSGRYRYSTRIMVHGELYQRARRDRQFETDEHNYREAGGNIGLALSF